LTAFPLEQVNRSVGNSFIITAQVRQLTAVTNGLSEVDASRQYRLYYLGHRPRTDNLVLYFEVDGDEEYRVLLQKESNLI